MYIASSPVLYAGIEKLHPQPRKLGATMRHLFLSSSKTFTPSSWTRGQLAIDVTGIVMMLVGALMVFGPLVSNTIMDLAFKGPMPESLFMITGMFSGIMGLIFSQAGDD